jgi:hypothetical protein
LRPETATQFQGAKKRRKQPERYVQLGLKLIGIYVDKNKENILA